MTSILALDIRISVGPRLIDEANKKLAMIEQLNFLRSVYSNNSFTAHPILAEVKAEVSGTKLFALIKDQ